MKFYPKNYNFIKAQIAQMSENTSFLAVKVKENTTW